MREKFSISATKFFAICDALIERKVCDSEQDAYEHSRVVFEGEDDDQKQKLIDLEKEVAKQSKPAGKRGRSLSEPVVKALREMGFDPNNLPTDAKERGLILTAARAKAKLADLPQV